MTADEIRAAIAQADDEQTMWALVVEHGEAFPEFAKFTRLEFHGWDGHAYPLDSMTGLSAFIRECLIAPAPVACVTASDAGLDVVNSCPRCAMH